MDLSTSPGTKRYSVVTSPWVAFEVDSVDSDGEGGWSVLVVDQAQAGTDAEDGAH